MVAKLENCCVLVVDDNQDTRDLLTTALEIEGAIVIAVDSAIAALETLEQLRPDVLLCDLAMPDVDGFTLMQQLREGLFPQWHQLPAIAMSAMYGMCYQQQAIDAGFQLYLAKPVDLDHLCQAIQLLLSLKSDLLVQSLGSRLTSTPSTNYALEPLNPIHQNLRMPSKPSISVDWLTLFEECGLPCLPSFG